MTTICEYEAKDHGKLREMIILSDIVMATMLYQLLSLVFDESILFKKPKSVCVTVNKDISVCVGVIWSSHETSFKSYIEGSPIYALYLFSPKSNKRVYSHDLGFPPLDRDRCNDQEFKHIYRKIKDVKDVIDVLKKILGHP